MSKYAKLLGTQLKKQQDLVDFVSQVDPRVDKSLLSKYANDVCLPTPDQLTAICGFLKCVPLDIYEKSDIDLMATHRTLQAEMDDESGENKNTLKTRRRRLDHKGDIYNLTVEISRVVADKVFSAPNLKRLGFLSITDLVKHLMQGLYEDATRASI